MYRDRTPELTQLQCRSLLFHGVADLVTPPSVIERYRKDTRGQLSTIDQAGHFAFVEQPDEYVRVVASFIMRD